jgi:protein-S-isoprenylcysteine O-methyltransferase Ste14
MPQDRKGAEQQDKQSAGTPDHGGVYDGRARIPPPLIFMAVFAAGFVLQEWFPVDALPEALSRTVAALCAGASAILAVSSFAVFGRHRTSALPTRQTAALAADGPYRFTRNPMYVSLTLLHAAFALWFGIFWALVLLPAAVAVVHFYVVAREERYLERRFGEEYLRYKARVRRWL